jgi:hypothetical protein
VADEKPLSEIIVGDRFWLAYGQEMVRGAILAPERRAEQLCTAISWFWTIYSTVALAVLTVARPQLPTTAALFIALPSVVLIFAYWKASSVRRAVLTDVDLRIPQQIQLVHAAAARQKRMALSSAEFYAGAGALSVVAALVVALWVPVRPQLALHAKLDAADPLRLLVLAQVPKQALVHIQARAASAADGGGPAVVALQRAADDGSARAELQLASKGAHRVTVTWSVEGLEYRLSTEVKPPE